jgi:DNA-binding SARP family transcriptional activator
VTDLPDRLAALADEARPAVDLLTLGEASRARSGHWRRRWKDRLRSLGRRQKVADAAVLSRPPLAVVIPTFVVECSQNEYLSEGAERVHALITVRATGRPPSLSLGDADGDPNLMFFSELPTTSPTVFEGAPRVCLRVWTPERAQVVSLEQVSPFFLDMTDAGSAFDPLTTDYPTSRWDSENRDYHLVIRVQPGAIGDEALAARVKIIVNGEPVGTQALVRAIWTDEIQLTAEINRRLAQATGEADLAHAIDEAVQALNAGDAETATVRFGRAVQLAHAAGDRERSELLGRVVDVEDASTGRVTLRKNSQSDIQNARAVILAAHSRRTTQVRTGTAAPTSPSSVHEPTRPVQQQDPNPNIGTPSSLRIGLLGPLQVFDEEGIDLTPRARKQRAVLAFLALRVDSVVRISDLIDALWGDSPILSAEKVIQGYISDLRVVVGRETIQTEPDGYRLSIPADAVDVTRFEHMLRSSAQALEAKDPRAALEWFDQASGLWRGEPLPDLADQITGETEATHLRELYQAGRERSFEARLALGEDESLIADLESAVAEEPYKERRWEQLMIALYRAGRQAEAIRAYQRLRTALNEELGIEPRDQTKALETAILNHDPSLDLIPDRRAEEAAAVRLPAGNVTFLFTDVEDSTRLIRRLGPAYPETLHEHRTILRSSVSSHDGIEVDTEGDRSFIVFADAGQALAACLEAQKALKVHDWPAGSEIRVRMGLHTGIAMLVDGGYSAISVRVAARICDAAHGGQVLLSADTARMVRHFLPEDSSLADRGSFMLNGFDEPERIFQLLHPEIESSFPPLRASPAQSHNLPDTRTSFVGRESELKAAVEDTGYDVDDG